MEAGSGEDALAERDAFMAKVEERVRVLERIATDDSARLRAEIDNLRDPRAPQSARNASSTLPGMPPLRG